MAFWEAMSPREQDAFETEALEAADTMKKRLYLEAGGKGGKAFEIYRQMVLKDQFERGHMGLIRYQHRLHAIDVQQAKAAQKLDDSRT